MGGFLYLSKKPDPNIDDLAKACREQFALQGFREPLSFVTGEYILDYYGKFLASEADVVTFANGDFVFATGTFLYRGFIGKDALQRFYNFEHGDAELEELMRKWRQTKPYDPRKDVG